MLTPLQVAVVLVSILLASASAQQQSTDEQPFEIMASQLHRGLRDSPRKGTDFDRLYQLYLDAGRLDDLTERVETLALEHPDDASSQMLVAAVCERRGKLDEALAAWRKASELAGDDYYPVYESAKLFARQYRYTKAIETFYQALEKSPEQPHLVDIHKRLGYLHTAQGSPEKALAIWTELGDRLPADRLILKELAELLAEEGQLDLAIARYRQLAKLADTSHRRLAINLEIMQLQARKGNLEGAAKTFEESLQKVPPDSWLATTIWQQIEDTYVQSGDPTELTAHYEERLKQHPQDLPTIIRYAAVQAKAGRSEQAMAQYRAALKVSPSLAFVRELAIGELVKMDNYDTAIEEATILHQQHPSEIRYLTQLGELHLKSSRDNQSAREERAFAVWRKIAELDPADAKLAIQVATLCSSAAGIQSGRRISATATDPPTGLTKLAEGTLNYYAEAVRRAPSEPQYHVSHGEFLYTISALHKRPADDRVVSF
ncbi:MAG: tetratricopeptide repeat protein [Planctomycetaceae bacterium]